MFESNNLRECQECSTSDFNAPPGQRVGITILAFVTNTRIIMGVIDLSRSQREALLVTAQVCASFSLCGSVFILACYEGFPHLRKLSFTLVAWLAVADIGADITYFMGNPDYDRGTCITQAALQQFFQMAQVLWTVAIAYVLRDVTVNLRMYHSHEQVLLMRRFHLAVWGVALLSMLLPFTTNSYGSTGAWCWIETVNKPGVGNAWRYIVLYIPVWAAVVFNIKVYVRIFRVVGRFSSGLDGGAGGEAVGPSVDQQQRMRRFVKRLFWYPVVLIISWTFATINRIQNAAHPSSPVFALFFFHTCLVGLQGFLNAIVYGSTEAVRDAVKQVPIVRRALMRWGRPEPGSGLGARSGTGEQGADPEDDTGVSGIAIGDRGMKYNEMMDDSLGIVDEVENDLPGANSEPTACVSESSLSNSMEHSS